MTIKDVKDFDGYRISDTGVVFGKHGRRLKPNIDGSGYMYVSLMKNGIKYTKRVHKLVADNLIDNTNNYPEVNHIDGNKLNNNTYNLEWVTSSQNKKHAWKLGLAKPNGLVMARRKLTPNQVIEIRRRYKRGCKIDGCTALGVEFGVTQSLISKIINNKERVKHETLCQWLNEGRITLEKECQ